jgi:protein TonB
LAWLGSVSGLRPAPLVAVQHGKACIELAASTASVPQQASPAVEIDIMRPETLKSLPDERVQRTTPPATPSPIPLEAARQDDASPYPELPPVEPDLAVSYPMELSLRRDRIDLKKGQATASRVPDDELPVLPRASANHRPSVDVQAEPIGQDSSIAAAASPASRASEGAETAPAVAHNPAPQYPPDALKAGKTGRVILQVSIAADGTVVEARVYRSSGVGSLDRAALQAVRRWRFSAAGSSTAPIRHAAVPIRFLIDEAGTNGHGP